MCLTHLLLCVSPVWCVRSGFLRPSTVPTTPSWSTCLRVSRRQSTCVLSWSTRQEETSWCTYMLMCFRSRVLCECSVKVNEAAIFPTWNQLQTCDSLFIHQQVLLRLCGVGSAVSSRPQDCVPVSICIVFSQRDTRCPSFPSLMQHRLSLAEILNWTTCCSTPRVLWRSQTLVSVKKVSV